MSDERKYRQHGYQDDNREKRTDRPPARGAPQRPGDRIGPRTPQFPARVTVARCAQCGGLLPKGFDPNAQCPRCGFELHCCKQCVNFDTGVRWECTKPITARVSPKDAKNSCTYYETRMSSERETTSGGAVNGGASAAPNRPDDPRRAFENLFKK